jgi:hypothetical protein
MGVLKRQKKIRDFATGDIETVSLNGQQVPILISSCVIDAAKCFKVEPSVFKTNPNGAVLKMFFYYFNYLTSTGIKHVFFHNLGGFDGRYIYNNINIYARLTGKLSDVDCLMD